MFFPVFFFPHQGKQVSDSLWKVWNTIFSLWELWGYSHENSQTFHLVHHSFQPSLLIEQIFATISRWHFITCLILLSKEQHSIFMKIWNLVNNYIILSTKSLFKYLGYLLDLFLYLIHWWEKETALFATKLWLTFQKTAGLVIMKEIKYVKAWLKETH